MWVKSKHIDIIHTLLQSMESHCAAWSMASSETFSSIHPQHLAAVPLVFMSPRGVILKQKQLTDTESSSALNLWPLVNLSLSYVTLLQAYTQKKKRWSSWYMEWNSSLQKLAWALGVLYSQMFTFVYHTVTAKQACIWDTVEWEEKQHCHLEILHCKNIGLYY